MMGIPGDTLDIEMLTDPQHATRMPIPRRIGCPEGLGAAGAFPRRWKAL